MDERSRLRSLLVEKSLAFGDFTLSSGARSSYYVDARLTTMSAEGQALIGAVGFRTVKERWPTARWVGGLTLGADPIAYAIAHRSWIEGLPLGGFTVRKKAKEHGKAGLIEGGLRPGEPAVVVEDTLTSGSSALQAVEAVRAFGCTVAGVLVLVDREVGGGERIRDAGHEVLALFTATELLTAAGKSTA
jgi:orotate phosphoribosyltransferase